MDSLTLSAPRAGSYTVRVRFSPYWALAGGGGCVSRAAEDWTHVSARRAGELRLADPLLARARVQPRASLRLSIV